MLRDHLVYGIEDKHPLLSEPDLTTPEFQKLLTNIERILYTHIFIGHR